MVARKELLPGQMGGVARKMHSLPAYKLAEPGASEQSWVQGSVGSGLYP